MWKAAAKCTVRFWMPDLIAPKIIGGRNALAPVGGNGCKDMGKALRLMDIEYKELGCDLLITGRTERD